MARYILRRVGISIVTLLLIVVLLFLLEFFFGHVANANELKLYDAATGGNQILLSNDNTGYYKDDTGSADTTIDINSSAGCNVRGLAPGTYYLEEVVVPGGYNKLAERQAVTVTTGQTTAVTVTVINNAGTELPSTGGMGTTVFYILGAVLVIGAGVVLAARRRVGAK